MMGMKLNIGARVARNARTSVKVQAATSIPAQYKSLSPMGERVFVKVGEVEEVTSSGILLPTAAQKKPTAGEVVSAGSAKNVKVGDRVVYSKFAGTEVELSGAEHIILKEDDCIGVLAASSPIAELKPLGDRVLVEVAEAASQSKGGVILTTTGSDKPTVGKVVAVGPGRTEGDKTHAVGIAAGATVLYSKYAGTEFEDGDKQYIVVREADILAVLA